MPASITATLPKTSSVTATSGAPTTAASTYWATVSGQRVARGTLSLPLWGAWVADVVMATDAPLPTSVVFAIGNLTLSGAVYRQTAFGGRTEARIVAGAGGWSKAVQARGYVNPGGVLASQVLSDAALEVGETVVVASDGVLGNFYERLNDKASRVLRAIASGGGEQWWIDGSGVTHVGPRVGVPITTDFQIEAFSGASAHARISTEDPASWLPGNTFSSATIVQQTIASVRHTFGDDGVARLEIMTSATNDRWIENVRQMIRDELAASMAYARIWEYSVVASAPGTVDAFPVDSTAPVPPVTQVPVRFGLGGGSITVSPGTHLAIGFLDANPAKPYVAGGFDGTAPLIEGISVETALQLGDSSAVPLTKASWTTGLITALDTFASALSTSVTLANVIASGATLASALAAVPASPTVKVLGS